MTLYKWSQTAATNASADATINWAEGQLPSTVNDSARAMMAAVAKYRDDQNGITTGGTSTAYTVTTSQGFTSLALLDQFAFVIIPHTNSGATPTLAVDGLTAKSLRFATGTAPASATFKQGTPYLIKYTNANNEFVVVSTPALFATGTIPSNGITTAMITDANVTLAKIANAAGSNKLLVSTSAGAAYSEGSAGTLLTLSSGTLALSTDTGSKCKAIGYDQSTGVPGAVLMGGPLLHIREQQTSGTNSTSPVTNGAFSTRVINNAVTNEITGVSIVSNQITGLPAGTYMVMGYTISAYNSSSSNAVFKARLRNVTDSTTLIIGSTEFGFGTSALEANVSSKLYGRFTIGASKTVELQAWHNANMVVGQAASTGELEVYTDVLIWRLA